MVRQASVTPSRVGSCRPPANRNLRASVHLARMASSSKSSSELLHASRSATSCSLFKLRPSTASFASASCSRACLAASPPSVSPPAPATAALASPLRTRSRSLQSSGNASASSCCACTDANASRCCQRSAAPTSCRAAEAAFERALERPWVALSERAALSTSDCPMPHSCPRSLFMAVSSCATSASNASTMVFFRNRRSRADARLRASRFRRRSSSVCIR
mmetsp:Transcript_86018/g.242972  ORF Transcript_86018/g.242972 Transcript_86018/m.242972 type:complete len:220 (-) Transcript_86018:70-729(-)